MHPDLEDPPAYEGVFLRAMKQVKELELAAVVFSRGLKSAAKEAAEIEKLNKRARRLRRQDPEFEFRDYLEVAHEEESEEERLLWAKKRAEFAEAQLAEGAPYLYNLVTIRLWGILEVMADDGVAELIQQRQSLRDAQVFSKFKVPFQVFSGASPAEQSAMAFDFLKDDTAAPKKNGVERFEALLEPIGLGGPYDSEVKKTVLELSAARHILVHRDGTVDLRFLERCPWVAVEKGQKLRVNGAGFHRYILAAEWIILEYDRRLQVLDGKPEDRSRLAGLRVIPKLLTGQLSSGIVWPPKKP